MHAITIVYCRKKDGGDDNNVDDENELGKIRGKKKANRGAPVRVAWYFCIIPRLRRWFATRKEAELLRCHDKGRKGLKKDGKFRHPTDSVQWGNINNHFLWFDKDAKSIRFSMSTDGVNPFGNQSSTHSTWPIRAVVVQPSTLAMQEIEICDADNIGLRAKATWRPY
jgi:hypothetical protein